MKPSRGRHNRLSRPRRPSAADTHHAPADRPDPLARLIEKYGDGRDVCRADSGRVWVTGAEAAREVLGNRRQWYVETSDFFHTRHGVFGPRSAQIEIGRAARVLLQRQLAARRHELAALVESRLAPLSRWPDAGNLLVCEHLDDVLLCRAAPASLRDAVVGVVHRAVLAGARQRHSALSRRHFRRAVMRALAEEITARRTAGPGEGPGEPRDLLDVVVAGGGRTTDPGTLAEVYLSFLFATVGSVGFALGWAVYLAGTHPRPAEHAPRWVVREALRLWPVAWLFTRTPHVAHELAGVPVGTGDAVDVCTLLVHRDPGQWDRPHAYLPGRWESPPPEPAFLPFGYGPHSCTGAAVALELLEDLIRIITCDWHLSVTAEGIAPQLGPALAPPRFTAELGTRVPAGEGR
ncbi:cytochrome P450 [Streptomyces sp. NPDC032198]|uniref:cytochrome P450 n=1 Tax=Streptomyces sp. NPDC032198 TaxID=3155127 RepID=UPI00340388B1